MQLFQQLGEVRRVLWWRQNEPFSRLHRRHWHDWQAVNVPGMTSPKQNWGASHILNCEPRRVPPCASQMKRQHHEVSSAKVITACNTVVYSKPSTMVNHPKFLQFLNQSLFLSHPKFGGWQLRHNPQHAGICLPSWRSRKVPSKDSRASLWSTHGRSCNRHWDWDWDWYCPAMVKKWG